MQYKEQLQKFEPTDKKIFILVFSCILFLILLVIPTNVYAQSVPDATSCPTGWHQIGALNTECCEDGTEGGQGANAGSEQPCYDSGGEPADKIVFGVFTEFFCPSGTIRLSTGTLGQHQCWSEGMNVPSLNKYFVTCKEKDNNGQPRQARPQLVTKNPGSVKLANGSPNDERNFDFCLDELGGIFVSDTNNCLCANGSEIAPPSGGTCENVCGRGNVIYDPEESGVTQVCSGAECCHGDQDCLACVGQEGSETGRIYTSVGCINPTREGIVVWLIRIALILTTTIGVFRFVQASFLIRSGDPEKIKEGQEIVTSAIIALVLVLLSVPLLQFIGVNVLGIFPEGFI